LNNVQIKPAASDLRPAIVCDDVQDLDLNGVNLSGNADAESLVRLQNVSRATLRNFRVSSPCNIFTLVEGAASGEIVVGGDNHVTAQQLKREP
jgi:hypothetical protein